MTNSTASIDRLRFTWRQDGVAVGCLAALCVVFGWRLIFTDLILPRGDAFTYFYPYWDYRNDSLRAGQIPLWNPYLFMGAPFLANSQAGVLYPLNWPLIWLEAPVAVKASAIMHLALASVGAYLFARRALSTTVMASLLVGALYGLGGYVTAQIEHINQLQGLAWLPWVFWMWTESVSNRRASAFIWLGTAVAAQLLAGHAQTAFITLVGITTLALWQVGRQIDWRAIPSPMMRIRRSGARTLESVGRPRLVSHEALVEGYWSIGALVAGSILAAILAAAQLLPTAELTSLSLRSDGLPFIQALSFSLRPSLIGRAFLPQYGGPSLFTEYVAYLGVVGLALALIGAWTRRREPHVAGLIVLAGVGVFLALGAYNPIYWGLVKIVPGFRLFRAPARWLALWALAASGLAGFGLDWLAAGLAYKARPWKALWPALVILALIALAFFAAVEHEEVVGARSPSPFEMTLWAGALGATVALLLWRRSTGAPFTALAVIELFAASQALPFNHLSTPIAWSSQRPAVSALLAAAGGRTPPDRFLSLSDIRFDPGDLREIEAAHSPYLDDEQLYDYVVAVKQKEILAPNLPLHWRIPAMDGFDGGALPTRAYAEFTALFLEGGQASADGRLSENLHAVPDLAWLRISSARWIVTDKTYDLWNDGVYYDLQFPATRFGAPLGSTPIEAYPDRPFIATRLGIIGHIEGGENLDRGAYVARLVVYPEGADDPENALTMPIYADGKTPDALRVVGGDAPFQVGFFTRSQPALADYRVYVDWGEPLRVERVEVQTAKGLDGALVIRGMTLIDTHVMVFTPLLQSPGNSIRLYHSGDVKIYEYRGVLPRAYVACDVTFAASHEAALAALPEQGESPTAVIERSPRPAASTCAADQPGSARIVTYQPERVVVAVDSTFDGAYLVLSDAWYPGWSATVDGQPAQIFRANGMFRAVALPRGTHQVEWAYRSLPFEIGAGISLTGWAGVLVYCVAKLATKRNPS